MAADTNTKHGRAFFYVSASAAAASGAALVLALPVHDTPAGGLLYLAEWLPLAAAVVGCGELAVTHTEKEASSDTSGDSRARRVRTTGSIALYLFATLLLIAARSAQGRAYTAAWAASGLLLLLVIAATRRVFFISETYGTGHTPSDSLPAFIAFVLAEACGTWLTVRYATEGPLWASWLLGCVLVALAAVFWLSDSRSWQEDRHIVVFGSAALLGIIGTLVNSAVKGEIPGSAYRIAAGIALPVTAAVFVLWAGRIREHKAVPPGAHIAGLVVPLASVVWGARDWSGWDSASTALFGVSSLVAVAAFLLTVQSTVLNWLDPMPSQTLIARQVHEVRARVDQTYERRRRRDLEVAYERERERMHRWEQEQARAPEQERERRWELERERRREWEREHLWEEDWERRREWERERHREREWEQQHRLGLTELPQGQGSITHPLRSQAVVQIHRDTAVRTGLAIDEVWPRIELVAPSNVKREVRRRERSVLACRLVAASAVCTAGVWLVIASVGANGRNHGISPALLGAGAPFGPLLLAAAAVGQARKMLVEDYQAKSDAIDVYRFDLAKSMQLAVPEGATGMIQVASELSGDSSSELPPRYRRTHPESTSQGIDFEELASDMVERMRREVGDEVRAAVRDEYATLAQLNPAHVTLPKPSLSRLARDVAKGTAGPLSDHLKDHLTALHREFQQDIGMAMRASLEEVVTGPPLTNFVGYLAIELERGAEEDPPASTEFGTITATVGRRLNLVLSVVRDARAQSVASVVASGVGNDFFVFEPVCIEGGRDAPSVSFDAMVDSSTLTPLPQRKNLPVVDEAQTMFAFQLPMEAGSHEVWFQLYQAGHLVQVAALKIEVEAVRPSAETREATGN